MSIKDDELWDVWDSTEGARIAFRLRAVAQAERDLMYQEEHKFRLGRK